MLLYYTVNVQMHVNNFIKNLQIRWVIRVVEDVAMSMATYKRMYGGCEGDSLVLIRDGRWCVCVGGGVPSVRRFF